MSEETTEYTQIEPLHPTDAALILRGDGRVEVANPNARNPAAATALGICCNILGIKMQQEIVEEGPKVVTE